MFYILLLIYILGNILLLDLLETNSSLEIYLLEVPIILFYISSSTLDLVFSYISKR